MRIKKLRSVFLTLCVVSVFGAAFAVTPPLANVSPFKAAKINWRQASGQAINVAVTWDAETDTLERNLKQFTQLTGIQINYHRFSKTDLSKETWKDFVSHTGRFDVAMCDLMLMARYASAKFVIPVAPYLKNPRFTDLEWYQPGDFFKSFWSYMKYRHEVYAIPFTGSTTLLMYRKDLFKARALKAPTTFDELWQAARTLNNPPATYGIALRGRRGAAMNLSIWTSFLKGFGGEFFNYFPAELIPTANSPEAVNATQFYANILKQYGPPKVVNWGGEEEEAALRQGKIAMTIDRNAFGPGIDCPARSKTAGKWAFAIIPGGLAGIFPGVAGNCLAINHDSQHQIAAWLFIEWATSPQMAYVRAMDNGLATRKAVWTNSNFLRQFRHIGNGTYTAASFQSLIMADGEFWPSFPHWREMGDILGGAVEAAIAGSASAETALNGAQERIIALLRKNGYLRDY